MFKALIRIAKFGHFLKKKPLAEFMKHETENLTFKEAFQKTGNIINITVTDSCHEKSRILNYITAPDVYVWSATIASCSLPFAYSSTKIIAKNKNGTDYEW